MLFVDKFHMIRVNKTSSSETTFQKIYQHRYPNCPCECICYIFKAIQKGRAMSNLDHSVHFDIDM